MLRLPLLTTPAVVVAIALAVPMLSREFVSVSIVVGLISVIGAWCAPATYLPGETGSLLSIGHDLWTPRLARLKALQLAVAGLMIPVLVALELLGAVGAAVFGIAAAVALGAFTGSMVPHAASSGTESRQH